MTIRIYKKKKNKLQTMAFEILKEYIAHTSFSVNAQLKTMRRIWIPYY